MASTLAKTFKRMYPNRITKEDVAERVKTGKITKEDYEYITGEVYQDGEA